MKKFFNRHNIGKIEYCVIAIRNIYKKSKDFEHVKSFFDSLYASGKIKTSLKGVLLKAIKIKKE